MPPTAPPRRGRVWLFDLDNTLHDATAHIFPRINRAMTEFIVREIGVDEGEANRLRMDYWARYGATLTGLVRHHGVDPGHFLRETHRFPDLSRILRHDAATRYLLKRLCGRKVLFTNGPAHYARAVLRAMKVEPCFDAVVGIEQLRYRPKPQTQAYLHLLARLGVGARQCVLVDDTLANLSAAKALGMTTVWFGGRRRKPPQVDVLAGDLRALAARFAGVGVYNRLHQK